MQIGFGLQICLAIERDHFRILWQLEARAIVSAGAVPDLGLALARSLSLANNVLNRFNDELRLITLDKVSALFGRAKLPMRRALGEILLKPSPRAIPRRELLFGHSIR